MTKTFFFKFDALSLENSGDVKLVELLVDIVDAELFVIIDSKVLKTENVKETDCLCGVLETRISYLLWLDCPIHHNNEPIEQIVEQLFGKSVFVVGGFFE